MTLSLLYVRRTVLCVGLAFVVSNSSGQTRIKTMMYNLLNYSNTTISQQKTPFLKTVLDEVNPDLLMVCELITEVGSNYMFNNAILPHNPLLLKKRPLRLINRVGLTFSNWCITIQRS